MGEPGDFYDPMGLMADQPYDPHREMFTNGRSDPATTQRPGDPDHNAGWTEEEKRLQQEAAERADRGFEAWGEFWISLLPGVGEAQEIREVSADPNLSAGEKVAGYAWAAASLIPAIKVIKIVDRVSDAADKVDDVRDATKSVDKAKDATKVGDKAADAKGAAQVDKAAGAGKGCPHESTTRRLTSSQEKAIKSYRDRIEEHKDKLEAYKRNPDAFDNHKLLENAPSDEVRQRIIDGRIRHLEREIKTFEDNIRKIEMGA
jgi:hypothetical protein